MTYSNEKLQSASKSRLKRFNPVKALRTAGRDFRKDKSGVAAIEFAFIAPIMITIYFGLAEVASAINVDRRVSHTANVVGDLATQSTEIKNDDVAEIFAAALRVLDIRDISAVSMEISSYAFDTQNPPVLQSLGTATLNAGSATLPAFDPATVDPNILNETSGVVVARIAYSYSPLELRFTKNEEGGSALINLQEKFLLKPRRSTSIPIGEDPDLPLSCDASTIFDLSCTGVAAAAP